MPVDFPQRGDGEIFGGHRGRDRCVPTAEGVARDRGIRDCGNRRSVIMLHGFVYSVVVDFAVFERDGIRVDRPHGDIFNISVGNGFFDVDNVRSVLTPARKGVTLFLGVGGFGDLVAVHQIVNGFRSVNVPGYGVRIGRIGDRNRFVGRGHGSRNGFNVGRVAGDRR